MGFLISCSLNLIGLITITPYLFITSIAFTSLGILIALKLASIKGFQAIVNMINMPLMFLSGIFFPVTTMPDWMKDITLINPLSYAVHSVRYWLTNADIGPLPMNPMADLVILASMAVALTYCVLMTFEKTTIES